MYFVNKNNHIVVSLEHTQIDVDGSIACYSDEEMLQIDYPNITDDMIHDIPVISPVEKSNGDIEYFLSSRAITHELILLDIGQTIEDWINTQAETFATEDGLLF